MITAAIRDIAHFARLDFGRTEPGLFVGYGVPGCQNPSLFLFLGYPG